MDKIGDLEGLVYGFIELVDKFCETQLISFYQFAVSLSNFSIFISVFCEYVLWDVVLFYPLLKGIVGVEFSIFTNPDIILATWNVIQVGDCHHNLFFLAECYPCGDCTNLMLSLNTRESGESFDHLWSR